MSHLLDSLPSKVVKLLNSPYSILLAGVVGGLSCCFSLLWFYFPKTIDPSLSASGFSATLSTPGVLNTCLISASIGGILLFDLILDISTVYIEHRSKQRMRNTKPFIEKENSIDQLKEFLLRFLFILCVLVSSISIRNSRSDYRCIAGYFAIRFRDIIQFSLTMFSVVDTFSTQHGDFLHWFCLACRLVPSTSLQSFHHSLTFSYVNGICCLL